jgi:hypothetical protein
MNKVLGMLVALAIFAMLPAAAFGQTVSSGNTQAGAIGQSASAGSGGNAGNQAAIVQQNAGRDANAAVNQSQNFSTGGVTVNRRVTGVTSRGFRTGVSGVGVSGVGGVSGVTLARTGFDAWILALVGGAALASGLGLLALQRRGRLSA